MPSPCGSTLAGSEFAGCIARSTHNQPESALGGSKTSDAFPHSSRISHHVEVASAVLLALATVGSAWCAYQSSRWSGVQAIAFAEANAARTESARLWNEALQLATIDVGSWLQYISALGNDNERLAEFTAQRFRPELKAANEAWLATEPLNNKDAPLTPFAMTAYSLPEREQAQRWTNIAEQKTEEAKTANQHSDNYVLLTVMFASVLFFGGISTKFESIKTRMLTLVIAAVVLTGATAVTLTFPVPEIAP